MQTEDQLKDIVKAKYGAIALEQTEVKQSCCGPSCCTTDEVYNIMNEDYKSLDGYNPNADLGLGCGLPTEFARIKKGDTVIDLGSGAGNDCFIARAEAGETGKIIGIDFTPAMIDKARLNVQKLGYTNIEFYQGDIENMPLDNNIADVVVSNCVLNLVPNKNAVFSEIFRVLKPGGHFSISDIVLSGELPEAFRKDAEMYAGCVSGAIQKEDYLKLITDTNFTNLLIQKQKPVILPDTLLKNYLTEEEIAEFKKGGSGIFSITVFAQKPLSVN